MYNMMSLFSSATLPGVPVPKDIPLPSPLPEWILVFLLVLSFLLHILFVNLMVGGSLLTLWAELKGGKDKTFDTLAREIAATITVNKSLAVVIGVAPLLTINTLYTIFFYSANALTGMVWVSLVPIVSIAFLLLYWHKYSWDKYNRDNKKKTFHIWLNGAATVLLLFVPLVFLTNINLMLFPGKWEGIRGFFSAMFLWNVIPRYLHFLCASLAVTGLFLFGFMKRKKYPFEEIFSGGTLSRSDVLKKMYGLALIASLSQLALGPLNLFTLPWHAVNSTVIYTILTGATFAIAAMYLLWRELKGPVESLGKRYILIALILSVTVLFMGSGRHFYRAAALAPHIERIQQKTQQHLKKIETLNIEPQTKKAQ
jgi:cytochrome c